MKTTIIFLFGVALVLPSISFSQIQNNQDVIICPSCFITCTSIFEQTEDVVYISPTNNQIAIVGNNSRDKPSAPTAGVFITTDGGQTWSENFNVSQMSGDPIVSIDNTGQFYFGGLENRINLHRFNQIDLNNVPAWSSQQIESDLTGDKPHLWIDNYSGQNKMYVGYTRNYSSSTPNQQVVIKKADVSGFNTWSSEVLISNNVTADFAHHGINICTGPQGQVYAVWSIYDLPFDDNIFASRDEDGLGFAKLDGTTFNLQSAFRFPNIIRGTRGSGIISNGTLSGNQITMFPSIACNQQNGHIYMAWTNIGEPGINTGDPDVYFIKSTDEGVTWSSPIRINQDPINNNINQIFPTVSCDPNTGVLAIGYLDSRNNHPLLDYYVALSNDDGQNWYDYRVSDASFEGEPGASNDYTWVDIKNNYIIPTWNALILDPGGCPNLFNNAFTSPFSIACQTDINNLCNINENTTQFHRASNSIIVAGNSLSCYYNVLASGGNVAFQAGNSIKFDDGFHSESGSTMHAYINDNCNIVGSFSNGGNQRVTSSNNSAVVPNEINDSKIKNFRVYPNPSQDKLYLTFNLQQEEQTIVTLIDISSKEYLILNKRLIQGFYKTTIDLNELNLNPGIYFINITTSQETKSIKFAKLE